MKNVVRVKQENLLYSGFRAMLPITTGIFPFGVVMGTVFAEAKLSFFQAFTMNFVVFAGASQLAAVDLMIKIAAGIIVVITGLIINLRFLLYSAALSPVVQRSNFWIKIFCAFNLTDQSYTVMAAYQDKLKTSEEAVRFYLGACLCMSLTWHASVILGFIFGNIAPAWLSLDFAVPLSFVALVIPTIKNKKYLIVAACSSFFSLLLYPLPYKIGLISTALLGLGIAAFLNRKGFQND